MKIDALEFAEINRRLLDIYGREFDRPRYRIVWSEDEYNRRWTKYTDDGFELQQPEVRNLPTYKQWIHEKYVLEKLIESPVGAESDRVDAIEYEPLHTFQTKNEVFLYPYFEACKYVIDNLHAAMARTMGVAYKDPEIFSPGDAIEIKKQKAARIYEMLFGNETDVTTSLAYGEGVTVPSNYEKEKV